jgi:parallel beta-helix repeat protein/predicted outer membrane repeat protein
MKILTITQVALFTLFITQTVSAGTINVPADQPTIQAGINAASDGDEVVIAPGTYNEIIDFNGKAITVRSSAGAALTIIDATSVADPGDGKPVVRCDSGEGPGTVLEGFTLTGGTGDTAAFNSRLGGGMYNGASSPTVNNCIFDGNNATAGGGMFNNNASPAVSGCSFTANTDNSLGGGMYNFESGSAPVISNCTFSENHAFGGGGGMYSDDGASPTVTGCTFVGNTSTIGAGGGFYISGGVLTMTNCRFLGNSAPGSDGGGMFLGSDAATVVNCAFSGNSAARGGGLYAFSDIVTVANCSFSANTATIEGGGIYTENFQDTLLTNCIFWENSDAGGMDESAQIHRSGNNGSLTVNYCDVQGGWTGDGGNNINADPIFVDADGADDTVGTEDDNLRLLADSPCIDVADFDTYIANGGTSVDLDGFARTFDDVFSANLGIGALIYLDMGPYEFSLAAPCPADMNGDGVLNFFDVQQFIVEFSRGCP